MTHEITDLYLEWENALSVDKPDAALVASIEEEAVEAGFSLREINETLLAGGRWNPDLHPRGLGGRFINVFGLVDLFDFDIGDGRNDFRGKVTKIVPKKNSPGSPDIHVDIPDRFNKGEFTSVVVKPSQVRSATKPKAKIVRLPLKPATTTKVHTVPISPHGQRYTVNVLSNGHVMNLDLGKTRAMRSEGLLEENEFSYNTWDDIEGAVRVDLGGWKPRKHQGLGSTPGLQADLTYEDGTKGKAVLFGTRDGDGGQFNITVLDGFKDAMDSAVPDLDEMGPTPLERSQALVDKQDAAAALDRRGRGHVPYTDPTAKFDDLDKIPAEYQTDVDGVPHVLDNTDGATVLRPARLAPETISMSKMADFKREIASGREATIVETGLPHQYSGVTRTAPGFTEKKSLIQWEGGSRMQLKASEWSFDGNRATWVDPLDDKNFVVYRVGDDSPDIATFHGDEGGPDVVAQNVADLDMDPQVKEVAAAKRTGFVEDVLGDFGDDEVALSNPITGEQIVISKDGSFRTERTTYEARGIEMLEYLGFDTEDNEVFDVYPAVTDDGTKVEHAFQTDTGAANWVRDNPGKPVFSLESRDFFEGTEPSVVEGDYELVTTGKSGDRQYYKVNSPEEAQELLDELSKDSWYVDAELESLGEGGSVRMSASDGDFIPYVDEAGTEWPYPATDAQNAPSDELLTLHESAQRIDETTRVTAGDLLSDYTTANAAFTVKEVRNDDLGVPGYFVDVAGESHFYPGEDLTRAELVQRVRDGFDADFRSREIGEAQSFQDRMNIAKEDMAPRVMSTNPDARLTWTSDLRVGDIFISEDMRGDINRREIISIASMEPEGSRRVGSMDENFKIEFSDGTSVGMMSHENSWAVGGGGEGRLFNVDTDAPRDVDVLATVPGKMTVERLNNGSVIIPELGIEVSGQDSPEVLKVFDEWDNATPVHLEAYGRGHGIVERRSLIADRKKDLREHNSDFDQLDEYQFSDGRVILTERPYVYGEHLRVTVYDGGGYKPSNVLHQVTLDTKEHGLLVDQLGGDQSTLTNYWDNVGDNTRMLRPEILDDLKGLSGGDPEITLVEMADRFGIDKEDFRDAIESEYGFVVSPGLVAALRARVHGEPEPVVAAFGRGRFNPDLHPRGRNGRFIDVFGLVSLFDFDLGGKRVPEGRGRVTKIVPDKKDRGNPDIHVELPNGRTIQVKPDRVGSGPEVKAKLDRRDARVIKKLVNMPGPIGRHTEYTDVWYGGYHDRERTIKQKYQDRIDARTKEKLDRINDEIVYDWKRDQTSPEFIQALREQVHGVRPDREQKSFSDKVQLVDPDREQQTLHELGLDRLDLSELSSREERKAIANWKNVSERSVEKPPEIGPLGHFAGENYSLYELDAYDEEFIQQRLEFLNGQGLNVGLIRSEGTEGRARLTRFVNLDTFDEELDRHIPSPTDKKEMLDSVLTKLEDSDSTFDTLMRGEFFHNNFSYNPEVDTREALEAASKIDYSPEAMQERDPRMGDPAEQARRLEGLGITPGPEYGDFNPTGKPYKDMPAEELGSKENPIITNDPMEAVKALHDGKHVQLQQVDQVSTMLDELGRIANEAREKGEKAGDYDLCKVTVPDTNLFCVETKGIPRIKMPQLSGIPTPGSRADALDKTDKGEVDIGPAFVAHLEDKGISVTETRLPASHLRASQNELVGAKVSGMMGAMQSGNPKAIQNIRESAISTTADNYVVDGHHRWAAVVGLDLADGVLSGDVDMPVRQIDMDIMDVLAEAYAFATDFGIPPKAGSGVEGAQEAVAV